MEHSPFSTPLVYNPKIVKLEHSIVDITLDENNNERYGKRLIWGRADVMHGNKYEVRNSGTSITDPH